MLTSRTHETETVYRTGPASGQQFGGGLGQLWTHRRLMWTFVLKDLRHRYTGSTIGFFWTVITPLLELVTYTFVFHVLIGVKFHPAGGWSNYALFLFAGMVTWMAFAEGLQSATTSIRAHAHLIQKLNFPAVILPAHLIASAVLNQFIRLGVLCVAAIALGHGLSWHLALVPVVVAVQTMLVLGLGLVFATMNVYFRDTIHWLRSVLLLGMFMTPIFYPASVYPQQFKLVLQLNPMAHLVGVVQELMLNHRFPHPHSLILSVIVSVICLVIGYSIFHHHKDRFSDLV
ncbi:MAG: ABC transporter permease [Myxococcota bacterium]|nr:ABC transporter permease [Myxococcota bacterium]MEC9390884.1 ABC transporter permease [Myxococcota bacterium]